MEWKTLSAGLIFSICLSGAACSQEARNSEAQERIERSLHAAGLTDISAKEAAGRVTLSGKVASTDESAHALQIAQSQARGEVVVNEISVQPAEAEGQAKDTQSDLDKPLRATLK